MVSTQQSPEITGLQLVHAFGDCDYVDKRGDTCHIDDYNEESYSSEEAYFLVPKADGTTAVQYDSYLKALTAGRKLTESDSEGAISAFEQAIVLNPNSATAYSELSWIRLSSKDYDAAKSDALKSIELGKALPVIQAMSYYNIGRALEAQKNTDDAIAAYMSSYTLRQHKVVAKRITELGKELPKLVWKAKALACIDHLR